MCGIVAFWGQSQGDAVQRVLEALRLLQYRAPDSAGLALVGVDGDIILRRAVGGPENLAQLIARQPLFPAQGARETAGEPDPIHFAFRLLGARVAAQEAVDPRLRERLDGALRRRLGPDACKSWREAWLEEAAANAPGHAFALAARYVQETIPGLAAQLPQQEWEQLGRLKTSALSQMVMGHGRWAMVGAVTEENAHPLLDRSRSRLVCENGSHNARLMLGLRAEQESWWRSRGLPAGEPVHRSENTTEVVAYEWERMRAALDEGAPAPHTARFLARLDDWGVTDPEERALRLALWRMRDGNAHACALYSRHRPDTLFISSHHKPIALIIRTLHADGAPSQQNVLVASDINAGLLLWSAAEVARAGAAIHRLQAAARRQDDLQAAQAARKAVEEIVAAFTVQVIFLDAALAGGEELLARITTHVGDGNVTANIAVSHYDGTPLAVKADSVTLNPTMVGKGDFDTYIESHIAEIPGVVDGIVRAYTSQQAVVLDGVWRDGQMAWPGLNLRRLQERFGSELARLRRIVLVGEGSSWRDAQAAAPLFRRLLPHIAVHVYRPVEILNLGVILDAAHDLALEISWSGATDSLLKVDALLAEAGLLRVAITGRAQSDLGRRAAASGGAIDVRSGVEVSVATVKGFEAILMTLDLLALQLASLTPPQPASTADAQAGVSARTVLLDELRLLVPRHLRAVIEDDERRRRLRQAAHRCRRYNKVAVVGASPIDLEGELKIEEIAQVVAIALDFHDTSLRPLIERSALVDDDADRTLFVFNATAPDAHQEARPLIAYLHSLGLFCIVHSTPHEYVAQWQTMANVDLFITPQASPLLQPLLDAPFFFDFAVALAYARGLSPAQIDNPRNLAKSVTTTGAEPRSAVEARPELHNIDLQQFSRTPRAQVAWDTQHGAPTRSAFAATVALRAALSVLGDPLPEQLALDDERLLLIISDTEATENGAHMSAVAWRELLDIDLAVYRRFISSPHPDSPLQSPPGAAWLRLIRAGTVLSLRDGHTIALPADMSPLQLELLTAVYLTGLALRRARRLGHDVDAWQIGLAQIPSLVAEILSGAQLASSIHRALTPYISQGYDKIQIVGGGQDYAAATSIARSLRLRGYMAEALYTDSAWHGPLATVGSGDAEDDTLIFILATDPLFQSAALVDTQVYRTRKARVLLFVPQSNEERATVRGVDANAVIPLPPCPRPFLPLVNAAVGAVIARAMAGR